MIFPYAGLCVVACRAWDKEIQLCERIYCSHEYVPREGPRISSATASAAHSHVIDIDEPPAYESLQVSRIATPPPKYDEVDQPIPIPTAFSETSAGQNY